MSDRSELRRLAEIDVAVGNDYGSAYDLACVCDGEVVLELLDEIESLKQQLATKPGAA